MSSTKEQDAWLESSKVAGRKKNSFLSSKWCLSAQFGTLERSPCLWLNQYFVRVNGSTENIQCHLWLPILSFAVFYYVQLFVTSNIFVFTKSTWNESLEVFPAARGAPGCSRGWESDFCQLQTLQLRICKIRESGSAATPLFMLEPFK